MTVPRVPSFTYEYRVVPIPFETYTVDGDTFTRTDPARLAAVLEEQHAEGFAPQQMLSFSDVVAFMRSTRIVTEKRVEEVIERLQSGYLLDGELNSELKRLTSPARPGGGVTTGDLRTIVHAVLDVA